MTPAGRKVVRVLSKTNKQRMTDSPGRLHDRKAAPPRERIDPYAFLRMVQHAFELAEQATNGAIVRHYTIGGYSVQLRFAGPALVPFLTAALEHLTSTAKDASLLTICVWDSASTHTAMPPCPWRLNDQNSRGEIDGYNTEEIRTAYRPGAETLSMLDLRRNIALYWTPDARTLPYYECGAPLLALLYWWMESRSRQLVHAGAVGTAKGGVLLVGKGGSGKSSTALSCLEAGLLYAGDDYCLIVVDPEPYAHSLYNSGKVGADDVPLFPLLASALSNAERLDSEKGLYFLHRCFPEQVSRGFPLRAIFLPRVTNSQETRLQKVSPSLSLRALAPSTIFQLPGAGQQAFSTLSRLVQRLPSYVLEVGSDRTRIPTAILRFLDGSVA